MRNLSKNKGFIINQTVELELIVSVAVVFAAFQIGQGIASGITWARNHNVPGDSPSLIILGINALFFSSLIPISVGFHFILRIYWLALVSLKSAFEDRTPRKIKFREPFQQIIYRSGNLDTQIKQVDMIASSIFAFSFLMMLSFSIPFASLIGIPYLIFDIGSEFIRTDTGSIITGIAVLLLFFASIFNMIDFFTIGIFKRSRFRIVRKIYYPIYLFFSILTLSFLYRGIYYNLAKYSQRGILSGLMILLIILGSLTTFMSFHTSQIYPVISRDNTMASKSAFHIDKFYESKFDEDTYIEFPFIDSDIILNDRNSFKLSFPVNNEIEKFMLDSCNGVMPFTEKGLAIGGVIRFTRNRDSIQKEKPLDKRTNMNLILDCFLKHVHLELDGETVEPPLFYFDYHHNPDRPLLSTMIRIDSLSSGFHYLSIHDSVFFNPAIIDIPFYKD